MNLLLHTFPTILHHPPARPGSKSPLEMPRAEGPRLAAPIEAAKGPVPCWRRWPSPLAVALQPLPSARGRRCLPPSGARPALGLASALISGSTKNRAEN